MLVSRSGRQTSAYGAIVVVTASKSIPLAKLRWVVPTSGAIPRNANYRARSFLIEHPLGNSVVHQSRLIKRGRASYGESVFCDVKRRVK